MSSETADPDSDLVRYVFGAGFVFGVVTTLLVLVGALTVAAGADGITALGRPLLLSVIAAVLFAAVVGSALFLLAFPENRVRVSIAEREDTDRQR
jgi:hypothetical protein